VASIWCTKAATYRGRCRSSGQSLTSTAWRMLLAKIRRAGVSNVSVHPGDARDLFDVLPEASNRQGVSAYSIPCQRRAITAGGS